MTLAARIVQRLLAQAGIDIDGPQPWDLQVHDPRFFVRLLREKELGLGESYMDRWWDCPAPDEMVRRLLESGVSEKARGNLRDAARTAAAILVNPQTRSRSGEVVERHYDLGNDLFLSFLDPYMQYSCGYFEGTDRLDEAQRNKMELICRKIRLSSADRLLDIGSGWGGLARYAAEQYGCAVTGINISKEQLRFASDFCRGLPVRFEERDYRAIEGKYSRVVSVGMFEHVGGKNYRTFMKTVRRVLEDDGIFLLHTIGSNVSNHGCNAWFDRYIFPNGMLPSAAQIARAAEGLFVVEDWHNLRPHYDRTLMAWNGNFQGAWPQLRAAYGERFKRMWEFYLLASAGAFRAGANQIWQVVLTPCGSRAAQPPRVA